MITQMTARILFLFVTLTSTGLTAERPNIVWLISEDNSKHYLKLFDSNGAKTPAIEALAKHGLCFDHAFSNSPVCSVARTTLMTSCFGPHIGTHYHRKQITVPLPKGLRMFPAYLRQAGYYTTNNRKKDYNAIEGKGVWDASSGRASWRNRKKDQPFFHMQSFGTSHESSLHFSKKVMRNQKTKTDPKSVFIPPIHPNTPTFRYTYARYHDRIQEVDRQIGRVVDRLKSDGLLESTFIFYFGDHGGVLPGSKGYIYETGLHVTLVVRVPKNFKHLVDRKLGSRVSGFVSFIDFGPTVLQLAGVKPPSGVDGKAFLGKGISKSEVDQRDEAFGYADRFDEKYDHVRTLRKGRFKYMRSYQPFNFDGLQNNYRYRMLAYQEWRRLFHAGKLNDAQSQFFRRRSAEALYDLQNDPYETKNLATDLKYAKQLKGMRGSLNARVKSLADLSMVPETVLVEKAGKNPTGFGKAHQKEIAKLVDIANLSLIPFDKAKTKLEEALKSKNVWERYWGLIACSSHGKAARSLVPIAKTIASGDGNLLVRVRAAEFLGLIGADDPRPVIMDALAKTSSGVEANLILNSLVLLRDGKPGYDFKITAKHMKPSVRKAFLVQRRLEYLAPK